MTNERLNEIEQRVDELGESISEQTIRELIAAVREGVPSEPRRGASPEARAIRFAAHSETNEAGQTNCVDLLALADRIEKGEVTVK